MKYGLGMSHCSISKVSKFGVEKAMGLEERCKTENQFCSMVGSLVSELCPYAHPVHEVTHSLGGQGISQ